MATQVRFRRGTTAQHSTFTGAKGEWTVNTSTNTLHLHNGTTANGFPLALASLSNLDNNSIGVSALALQTRGEVLVYGASGTPTALTVGSAGQKLLSGGSGANVYWGTETGREAWMPTQDTPNGNETNIDSYPVGRISSSQYLMVNFRAPSWYNGVDSADIIFVPGGTDSSMDIDLSTSISAVGQPHNTHTEQDTTSTYSVTNNEMSSISVTSLLDNLAADDLVGIWVKNNSGTNINFLGLHVVFS